MGVILGAMIRSHTVHITSEILSLIAGIDEFKGAWRALGTLAPDRLSALRRVATIESIGSSTRIEGSRLSDREVERLLSNLQIKPFNSRDEQEVAGYAEVMELVFSSWQDINASENHVRQSREASTDREFRLAHILVLVPEQATSAQIDARRKRAALALSELRKGADFAQISAQYSEAPDALQGGDLGWRPSGRLPAIFLDALSALKPGETTDILRSANGFHIVKVLDKRGASATPTVQQTRARHILIKTKEGLSDDDARQRLARLRERIIGGADFAELAKVHSDDPSATKGGDLSWLSPGDTVPEFERTMNQLRDNEISAPTQSQFGWHLIQVQERRTEGVSEERRRTTARNAIRARKTDEAVDDWLRQAKDRAFVELKLEEK